LDFDLEIFATRTQKTGGKAPFFLQLMDETFDRFLPLGCLHRVGSRSGGALFAQHQTFRIVGREAKQRQNNNDHNET